ncbi:alpha-L-fucosidase [Wenyingzhuangia sp. IMCC45467]
MKKIIIIILLVLGELCFAQQKEKLQKGKFKPTWKSLEQYQVPEWFRDAKFGIWAHWGPQCEPEAGDWYGRNMYTEGHTQYKSHIDNYGHPSEFGFKDVIHEWKAENWNPEKLVALYKRAGAKYFFAMGNHHDNLDLWNSKYQEWNSVDVGPHKNILEGWAKASRNNGLPFGVSIHSAHAWLWYETSQGADKKGSYAGVPYDSRLTKKEGKGKWWNGLDPQKLYVQNHLLSKGSEKDGVTGDQWGWQNGASIPSEEYCLNFYNRTVDMINKFSPDLIYFDDTALPLWPISNVGLDVAAHYYNTNMSLNNGKLEGVIFGKILTEDQKKALVWDVERGAPDNIQQTPWQSCTCIGNWHYKREIYQNNKYKTAKQVIQILADIVSKNGNLLLNIPIRGDGTIDEKELEIVKDITAWMDVNKECIYETRPWHIYGEGPSVDKTNPLNAQGFNEGKREAYSQKDIRFTKKGNDVLYAIIMEGAENNNDILIKSLSINSPYNKNKYKHVELLGGKLSSYEFNDEYLKVTLSGENHIKAPLVLKIY